LKAKKDTSDKKMIADMFIWALICKVYFIFILKHLGLIFLFIVKRRLYVNYQYKSSLNLHYQEIQNKKDILVHVIISLIV
jgi:hypothetical protein